MKSRDDFYRDVYLAARRQKLKDEMMFAAAFLIPVAVWVLGILLIVYGWPV